MEHDESDLELDFDAHSRKSDPISSNEAAKRVHPTLRGQRRWALYEAKSRNGMSVDDMIAPIRDENVRIVCGVRLRKRLPELRDGTYCKHCKGSGDREGFQCDNCGGNGRIGGGLVRSEESKSGQKWFVTKKGFDYER